MKNERIEIKKRLMFLKADDFYYITYNIFILLNELKCYGNTRVFKDYKKLAYLLDFVSDKSLVDILHNYCEPESKPNASDKQVLYKIYSDGAGRINQLMRLLFALEKHGYVHLEKDKKNSNINIWIDKDSIPNSFFDSGIYYNEVENSKRLKNIIPRLSSLTLKILVQKIFDENGVRTWDV